MVVFLDLDDDVPDAGSRFAAHGGHRDAAHQHLHQHRRDDIAGDATMSQAQSSTDSKADGHRTNPNVNGFSAILSCYPYALSTTTTASSR